MRNEYAEELESLRVIAGDTFTLKYAFYRDTGDPIPLGSCKEILWSLAPYGMNGPAVVTKKLSGPTRNGITVSDTEGEEVEDEGFINNVCYVTIDSADTKRLCGKYESQMTLTDLSDKKYRKVRGTVIISRANED